jgi:hypothetical protein
MMHAKSAYCHEILGIATNWKEVDASVPNKACEYIMGRQADSMALFLKRGTKC